MCNQRFVWLTNRLAQIINILLRHLLSAYHLNNKLIPEIAELHIFHVNSTCILYMLITWLQRSRFFFVHQQKAFPAYKGQSQSYIGTQESLLLADLRTFR